MKQPEENIVSYSAEELERLPRLDGAQRPMTDEEITRAIQDDPDAAPELTEKVMASARPAHEVLPEIFPADVAETLLKKRGRPKSERPKIQFTARFDADIVEHFRRTGKGWQIKMEDVLRKAIAMGL